MPAGADKSYTSLIKDPEIADEEGDNSDAEEHEETLHFEPDVYTASIVVLVRDLYRMSRSSDHRHLRVGRIVLTLFLMFANIGTQIFLLVEVKHFVSAKAVHDIRNVYGTFEAEMYPNHTYMTVNGKPRGIHGYYVEGNFDGLSDDQKESVCNIPFSQPRFISVVLLIWSMTCFGEMRATLQHFQNLIVNLPEADSMARCKGGDGPGEKTDEFVIARLPKYMKAALTLCIFLPRLGITAVLLWLGCRWLSATNDFTDLLLNGVALEFIISLKSLLYTVLIPGRTQRQSEITSVKRTEKDLPTLGTFVGAFSWGFIACAWVLFYYYWFQQVLPDYKFDVHDVCEGWMKKRYAV